jgi:3D (Asp-Asp-Asp) domain-containing protein
MEVLRRYTVMLLGLASACFACALLCGSMGMRGSHTAVAAEPLAYPSEEPACEVPSESSAAPAPGAIEMIPPVRAGQGSSVLAPPAAVMPGAGIPAKAGPVSVIAPDRLKVAPPAKASPQPSAPPGMRARTVRMRVTAYCPCAICCGRATGITASGLRVSANGSHFAATGDERLLPMGSKVSLPGYNGGRPVPVIDRMADEDEPRLDVYFPSHQRAREWGVKWMDVTVYVPVKTSR